MIDSYISVEQKKREKQEPIAIEQQAKVHADLYSEGWLDGLGGLEPSLPDIYLYWQGYQLGQREYWCQQRGLEIPKTETFESGFAISKLSA